MKAKVPRRALIVVDVQENLVAKRLYEGEQFLSAVRDAIQGFRKSGGLVVFIRHCGAIVERGSPGWELYAGLDRRVEDPVVDKKHGNAFLNTDLARILEAQGIRDIIVCGLVSHGCVRATCLGGAALGLRVRLLKKGHSNWAKDAPRKIDAVELELAAAGIETTSA
jgi:nicotinamidase-related amidase